MTEWKTYRLGDITIMRNGKKRPNTQGKYPVYGGNGIMDYADCYNAENTIIVGRVGAYCGNVYQCKNKCWVSDNAISVSANELVDDNYLYDLMSSLDFHHHHIGGAQPLITQDIIGGFEIFLPPLEEQRRIAGILGAIDDKIENNRRINTNLELQAQALYKQWFVDNRKDDWEEKQLGEIALHITDGVHNTVIDSPNGEYYLLSCKNIKSGQLFIGSNERRIDHETFTKLRKRTRLSQGDILVTSVGTVGEMYLVNESPSNYEFQRSVAIIKPNQDIISSYFLYAALLYQRNEIKHLAHGAVQQCIFISDLKEYSFIVPNKNNISAFDEVVAPMFNKIGELQKENEALSTLRDTLLPKLMNGEIKVTE